MDVDGYSARAEAFATELARRYYRQFAGLEPGGSLGALYEDNAGLFGADAVERLREAAASVDGPPPRRGCAGDRRLAALLRFAAEGYLGRATATLDAELVRREGAVRIGALRLGEVAHALAHEADAGRRAELEAERCRVIEASLAPIAAQITEARHEGARALGWPSYARMCGALAGVDLSGLRAQAERFLAETDAGFAASVAPAARDTLGIELEALARADLPRLFRQPALDGHFPPDGLTIALAQALGDLGIDLEDQANIVLDLTPRATKSRRAFCVPVRVPGEVYLVLAAAGGWEDYAALLHEAGHAEHFASADPALPFESRRLSDPAVGEAFAFLLEGIADEPAWLQARGVGGAPNGVAQARRLLLLRRYAAKLCYELELHGGGLTIADAATVYAARLSAAVRVAWPAATWLTDLDPGLYVAHYLRAWTLAERLREALLERFGPGWFAAPAAGRTLQGWWRQSHGLTAQELLTHATGDAAPLDFAALAQGFRTVSA